MGECGGERKAEGEDVMICEKIGSQSVLVKRIVFRILNDEEGAKRQRSVVLEVAVRFMGSGDTAGY